jgi:glycerophosphoryl diester phosphodiesterase
VIRVGHKGADHVAPGNTVESFQAALEHGVDMIEFDVLRTRGVDVEVVHIVELLDRAYQNAAPVPDAERQAAD